MAEVDPNVQIQVAPAAEGGKPKRQRVSAKAQFEQSSFEGQYEYACIGKPSWAEENDEDRDGDGEQSRLVWRKPSSEHPEWKWVMLRESFDLLDAAHKDVDKRDPDVFGMYIYNDFLGYGIIEVLENMVRLSILFTLD